MGERRGVYRVVVWKPDGKSPLGGPRHRWEDNIKMDLNLYRTKVTFAVTQVKVICLKNSGRQWT
jgi:hypothetical protein